MTRYTINIGDDFPIGDDDKPRYGDAAGPDHRRRGPRFGTVLRILFAVSVIAVVVHHAVQVAVITGLILLLRRHPRFQELRSRMRGMSMDSLMGCSRNARRRGRNGHGQHDGGKGRDRDKRGYESFV